MQRIIFFTAGVAVGAAVSYAASKRYFEKICENEIESVKQTYMKKAASKEAAEKNREMKAKVYTSEMAVKDNNVINTYKTLIEPYRGSVSVDKTEKEESPIVTHNVFSDAEDDGNFLDEDEEFSDSIAPSEGLAENPYIISNIEFENEMPHFDKFALYIYSDGVSVLEDGNDSMIEDITELIGHDALDHVGEFESNVVFVRNEQRSSDYEVIILKEAYFPDNDPLNKF